MQELERSLLRIQAENTVQAVMRSAICTPPQLGVEGLGSGEANTRKCLAFVGSGHSVLF